MADMAIWMENLAAKYDVDTESIDFVTEMFSVEESTTRGSAAGIFSRFFKVRREDAGPHGFDDVEDWSANSVSSLKVAGITAGCGTGGSYCGTRPFTRGHAAAYMGRFVEEFGAARARTATPSSGLYAGESIEWAASQYVITGTSGSSSVPATESASTTPSCAGPQHYHVSTQAFLPPFYCHSHANSVPLCSSTAGDNRSYNVHVDDGDGGISHLSGYVPACPPPKIDPYHSKARHVVTSGEFAVIVLQADDEAQVPREYDVTLIPYTQTESQKAECLSEAPKRTSPRQGVASFLACTDEAVPGEDYDNIKWLSVTIPLEGNGVMFELVDPNTDMAPHPRQNFGPLPRQYQVIITDVKNPAVVATVVITINAPLTGSS